MRTATKPVLFKAVESISPDHIHSYLIKYWKSGRTIMKPRQMLFTALSAFWLPFALHGCGEFSPGELSLYAAISIRQLQEQIHEVEMHFLVGDANEVQYGAFLLQPSAERSQSKDVDDQEFSAIHKVRPNHMYFYLVKYWKSERTIMEPRQMLFAALSAFWLPFALHICGQFSPSELREYAAIAREQLQEQIHLLKTSFWLNETTNFSVTADVKPDSAFELDQDEGVDDSDLFN